MNLSNLYGFYVKMPQDIEEINYINIGANNYHQKLLAAFCPKMEVRIMKYSTNSTC